MEIIKNRYAYREICKFKVNIGKSNMRIHFISSMFSLKQKPTRSTKNKNVDNKDIDT